MEAVYSFIDSITPEAFNGRDFLKFAAFFIIGMLVISLVGRLILGKKSTLNRSVCCAISILCMYVVNVVIYSLGLKLDAILAPLPFVSLSGDYLLIDDLLYSGFSSICTKVLNMLILAFLVGLLDSWLPQGKKLLSWFAFRVLSVVLAMCLHYVVSMALLAIVPQGVITFAPAVLIIILVAAILLGSLKILVGGALAIISPILGVLYTFFFSNIVGKQLSKAVLTTAILSGLVCLLNYFEICAIYIGSAVLIAYLPLLLVVLVLWYVISHLL
ncbi:MAG: hypothetical protein IJB11_03235 [Oscillospiraceae bacterium]|nr:hypothetical protein [Oscillospiraceae bacterium]